MPSNTCDLNSLRHWLLRKVIAIQRCKLGKDRVIDYVQDNMDLICGKRHFKDKANKHRGPISLFQPTDVINLLILAP